MRRYVVAVIGAVLVLYAEPQSWVRTASRWSDTAIPVRLVLDIDPWNGSAESALSVWNEVRSNFWFTSSRGSDEEPSCRAFDVDERNVVVFRPDVCGNDFGRALAITQRWYDTATGITVDSDVVFNSIETWSAYRGNLRRDPDIRRAAIHEFGHVLGLGHPDDEGQSVHAIMNSRISDVDELTSDDIDGVFGIYGGLRPVNQPPTVTVHADPDQVAATGEVLLTADASDPDGRIVGYTWTAAVGRFGATGMRQVYWTAPDRAGSVAVTVTVVDDDGASAQDSVFVRVLPPINQPPTVTVHADPDQVVAGGNVVLTADASDPDGRIVGYTWTAAAGRLGATRMRQVYWTAPDRAGSVAVTVTVVDDDGASARDSASVKVFPPRPPLPSAPRRGDPIRARDFADLRDVIDWLREVSGLPAFRWSDPILTPGITPIKLVHLIDLREAIETVYRATGQSTPRWTDPYPTAGVTPIKAAHLTELRAAVLAADRIGRAP